MKFYREDWESDCLEDYIVVYGTLGFLDMITITASADGVSISTTDESDSYKFCANELFDLVRVIDAAKQHHIEMKFGLPVENIHSDPRCVTEQRSISEFGNERLPR